MRPGVLDDTPLVGQERTMRRPRPLVPQSWRRWARLGRTAAVGDLDLDDVVLDLPVDADRAVPEGPGMPHRVGDELADDDLGLVDDLGGHPAVEQVTHERLADLRRGGGGPGDAYGAALPRGPAAVRPAAV